MLLIALIVWAVVGTAIFVVMCFVEPMDIKGHGIPAKIGIIALVYTLITLGWPLFILGAGCSAIRDWWHRPKLDPNETIVRVGDKVLIYCPVTISHQIWGKVITTDGYVEIKADKCSLCDSYKQSMRNVFQQVTIEDMT